MSDGEPITRQNILAAHQDWSRAMTQPRADAAISAQLGQVQPGAEVIVWLGTWCPDSRREVTRFWSALDHLKQPPPFSITYRGVARGFRQRHPDLQAVPTFIVRRDDKELGRIVETAESTIEADLLALLQGRRTGTISASR